ncbi:hypothetical protein BDN72DRAFT_841212 [Pluteus cervinus]|uniref:Uncharacterized protein n=1 Tax=Pluteus cervinus TaxID=181527 RepID=A0ACD3AT65_9AGAR|nr:hypothetical protein BDN72DRAFT_841212 [Pluteus cervinus]
MSDTGSRNSRASASSSIRASVLNVCIQLGALDDNSAIADLMFGEATDASYDYFEEEDRNRGRTADRKIRFVSPPPPAQVEPDRTVSSMSSRLAAKLGFGSKRRRSGEEVGNGNSVGQTEEVPSPTSPKSVKRSLFNVVHRRSRSGSFDSTSCSPARNDSSRYPGRRLAKPHYVLRSRSDDWEEITTPARPTEFEDNVFLGHPSRKLTARPLSSYRHSTEVMYADGSKDDPLPPNLPLYESLHHSMPRPRKEPGRSAVPSSFKARPSSVHFPKLARSSSLV